MNESIFCIKILEYQAPPRAYKRLEKWGSSYEVTVVLHISLLCNAVEVDIALVEFITEVTLEYEVVVVVVVFTTGTAK